jgi:hypothetical protein
MNVKHLLGITEANELRSKLHDFLNNHGCDFDFEPFCKRGGYAEFEELHITDFDRTTGVVNCKLEVGFNEVETTTCSEVSFDHSRSCIFNISIDDSGEVEILDSTQLWDGEEHGEQQFEDEIDPGYEFNPTDDRF